MTWSKLHKNPQFLNDLWTSLVSGTFYMMHMNWYTFLFTSQKKTAVIMLKISGATVQKLVTQATGHLWTVHPWSTILLNIKFKESCIFNLNPSQTCLADQCPCSIRHISSWVIQKIGSQVWILLRAWLYFLRCITANNAGNDIWTQSYQMSKDLQSENQFWYEMGQKPKKEPQFSHS